MRKNTKPQLRFSEFQEQLKKAKLGTLTDKVGSGSTPKGGASSYVCEGIPLIRSQNVKDGFLDLTDTAHIDLKTHSKMKGSHVHSGDALLNITGASIGRSCVVPDYFVEGNVNQHVCIIRPKKTLLDVRYLEQFLRSKYGQRQIDISQAGGGREGLNFEAIKGFSIPLMSNKEQQKIADFLTSVDSKISQLTEKHRLLKEYKKGVMQQMFSQQIHFKNEGGEAFPDWKKKHFGEVFNRVTQKNTEKNQNVLTISAQKGLVSQLDYFNKSVAAKDVSGYYLLEKGDFAYNKSYSQGYPMGAIKPLKLYDKGVVSTLYICFRPKAGFSGDYFEQFFNAGMLNREITKIAQEGARNHGLLNVSVKEFFEDIKLPVPHEKEQQKIAQFLQSIDNKIDAVAEQIEQTKQFKKGLLQQMFV